MSTSQSSGLLARSTDPQTSHRAVPSRASREEQKEAILWLLTNVGPMTDHELTFQYQSYRAEKDWPATQTDSIRKRRSDLKNEGRVHSTGKVSGFILGHAPSTVWAATE